MRFAVQPTEVMIEATLSSSGEIVIFSVTPHLMIDLKLLQHRLTRRTWFNPGVIVR
jgi:hypothetical protein